MAGAWRVYEIANERGKVPYAAVWPKRKITVWWQFQKIFEDERSVHYAYSCDNADLDGIIQYDRKEETVKILRPCKGDGNSEWAQTRSARKMFILEEKGFPEKRQMACG